MNQARKLALSERPVGRRRVTAAEVARRAGVSRTTVSYVLNDRPGQSIPEHTRQRVLAAAAELGYAPSAAAQALATGRSHVVLGILPDWPHGPVVGRLLQSLTAAYAGRGLTYVTYAVSGPDLDLPDVWQRVSPDAVLALDDLGAEQLDKIRAAGLPVVVLLRSRLAERPHEIELWDQQIGRLQARHLAAMGHLRIGYAWPNDTRLEVFAQPRLAGVRAACADLGLLPPMVQTLRLKAPNAALAVNRWRDHQVTGIAAYNDNSATAVLAAVRFLDLAVPDDIAVIGVDDLPTSAFTEPPLSTIRYDYLTFGEFIAEATVGAIERDPATAPGDRAFVSLVQRASS